MEVRSKDGEHTLFQKTFYFCGYTVFFLSLFFPTTYKNVKIFFLSVAVLGIVGSFFVTRKLRIDPVIFLITIFVVFFGLFSILTGLFYHAPGALDTITVHVYWPILYITLISALHTEKSVFRLNQIMAGCLWVLMAYVMYYLAKEFQILPIDLYIPLDMGQSSTFETDYSRFSFHSFATLLFLVPFVVARVIMKVFAHQGNTNIWLDLFLIAAYTIIIVISGRRAMLLTFLTAPFIAIAFCTFLPRKRKIFGTQNLLLIGLAAIALASVSAIVFLVINVDFIQIIGNFIDGFDLANNLSANTRLKQFGPLIQSWLERPLFGSGLGNVAMGPIRDKQMPWAYELTYFALLFQFGIIGMTFFLGIVTWLYAEAFRLIGKGGRLATEMVCIMTGLTSFLIANATNPYLLKFDCLWVIFVPLAYINYNRRTQLAYNSFQNND